MKVLDYLIVLSVFCFVLYASCVNAQIKAFTNNINSDGGEIIKTYVERKSIKDLQNEKNRLVVQQEMCVNSTQSRIDEYDRLIKEFKDGGAIEK